MRRAPNWTYRGIEVFHQALGEHFPEVRKSDWLPLQRRPELMNLSPFLDWGYRGAAAQQLALALLADATGSDALALRYYRRYTDDVISKLELGFELHAAAVALWAEQQVAAEPLAEGLVAA
jgi:hypothetical protein